VPLPAARNRIWHALPDCFISFSGSHIILRRESPFARVSVPNHKTLRLGTPRSILNEAGLSAEQLIALR
jgi:hypothetical protein